jgi:ribosomal protein S18 acetylase RimI-like enzyme
MEAREAFGTSAYARSTAADLQGSIRKEKRGCLHSKRERHCRFYKQTSDRNAARNFLEERLKNKDSVIFTAKDKTSVLGFTQLYPSFSSVAMRRIWILNDLYVEETHRRKGVGKLLMDTAERYARDTGAVKMILVTQFSNTAAQKLYEARGYVEDKEFHHYALLLR